MATVTEKQVFVNLFTSISNALLQLSKEGEEQRAILGEVAKRLGILKLTVDKLIGKTL